MTVAEAIAMIRNWRMKPKAVDVLLEEYERLRRELEKLARK